MASKIPTTIEGKKVFFVLFCFFFLVYKQSLSIHEYCAKAEVRRGMMKYIIDDRWTMIVVFLFMHSLFTCMETL